MKHGCINFLQVILNSSEEENWKWQVDVPWFNLSHYALLPPLSQISFQESVQVILSEAKDFCPSHSVQGQ